MFYPAPVICSCAMVIAMWIGLFLPGTFASAQSLTVEVRPVSGPRLEGTIDSIAADSVSILTSSGRVSLAFENINSIQFGAELQPPVDPPLKIQWVDGSELNAKSVSIESGKVSLELRCGLACVVSTRDVTFIQFKTYERQPELSRQWRELLDDDSRVGDAIVVNRADELNAIEGITGDLDRKQIGFTIEDRTARIPLEKMDAVLFYHATGRELEPPVCEMLLTDGSRIMVHELKWENNGIKALAVCGSEFEAHGSTLAGLNFSLGRDVWLSSLEPSTNDWQPLMTSDAILEKLRRLKLARVNQSFTGRPLSLKFYPDNELSFSAVTKQFENGYSIQSGGKLAFALNQQYKTLTGWVGFDPTASPSGNVLFKILVDGKVILEKELIHRVTQNPLELNINIEDADRIVFQVDYHDGRSTGDQLNLVDLKVSR